MSNRMTSHSARIAALALACSLVGAACSGHMKSAAEKSAAEKSAAAKDPCYVGPVKETEIPVLPSAIRPGLFDASALETRTPIKHVVFIMKENRTFDNLFGAFPGADGTSTGMQGSKTVSLRTHCFSQVLSEDMLHDYPTALINWNKGQMNQFGGTEFAIEWAYTQASQKDIPNYWRWAQDFALSDNFFSSVLAPSFPNHLYSLAGTAAGTHDNPVPRSVDSDVSLPNGYEKAWGCDAPKSIYVNVDRNMGSDRADSSYWYASKFPLKKYPCLQMRVLPDALKEAGVPWAYYGAENTQVGYFWVAPDYIDHIRNDPMQWSTHVFGVDQIVSDIQDDRLPPVTWVTPQFWLSDHPDASICLGENWTTQVVNSIMDGPMWQDTAIFIVWDDWGGFYDHVPPPDGLGFRTPALTISPYTKQGFIDKTQGDFGSIVRFIEYNWNLQPGVKLDIASTNDMTQNFDFTQPARPADPLPMRHDCRNYEGASTDQRVVRPALTPSIAATVSPTSRTDPPGAT